MSPSRLPNDTVCIYSHSSVETTKSASVRMQFGYVIPIPANSCQCAKSVERRYTLVMHGVCEMSSSLHTITLSTRLSQTGHRGHLTCRVFHGNCEECISAFKPEKQRARRRYLEMVNYYHRFIPHCAAKLTPLNNLLTAANEGHTRLSPKSNFDLKWNKNAESAFSESKQILANATLLVHPDSTAQINITCDASDVAVGSVLQQFLNGMWQPL